MWKLMRLVLMMVAVLSMARGCDCNGVSAAVRLGIDEAGVES